MFVGTLSKRCEAQGALRAWRLTVAATGESEAPAP
jgi:hypothetical protein